MQQFLDYFLGFRLCKLPKLHLFLEMPALHELADDVYGVDGLECSVDGKQPLIMELSHDFDLVDE